MENLYLQSVWQKLAILNTENIKICGSITKPEVTKMQLVWIFFLNICRKFEFSISQGRVSTCLRWGGYCRMGFVANFTYFPAVQNFENRFRFDKVTESLKVGTFLRHSVDFSSDVWAIHITWTKLSVSLSVTLNGGTNCNRCTQRTEILHSETYYWTVIGDQKLGHHDLLYWVFRAL